MILWDLFLGFLKVGCFSFGGAYAAIPLIRDVVIHYGWLEDEKLTYMIAVSESTPGPIMVNMATYVGASQAGILGAAVATFAVILPAFLIVLMITAVLSRILDNQYVRAVLCGIKPSMAGIILATGCWMTLGNLFEKAYAEVNFRAVVITIILGLIYFLPKKIRKVRISPIMLILIAAVLGMIGYAI